MIAVWVVIGIVVLVILVVVGLSCCGVALCCYCCKKTKQNQGQVYQNQQAAQMGAKQQGPCPTPVTRSNGGVVQAGTLEKKQILDEVLMKSSLFERQIQNSV